MVRHYKDFGSTPLTYWQFTFRNDLGMTAIMGCYAANEEEGLAGARANLVGGGDGWELVDENGAGE